MTPRQLVVGTLLVVAPLWLGLDAYWHFAGQPTITQYVQGVSARYPAVPLTVGLVVGLILGHLFYQF